MSDILHGNPVGIGFLVSISYWWWTSRRPAVMARRVVYLKRRAGITAAHESIPTMTTTVRDDGSMMVYR